MTRPSLLPFVDAPEGGLPRVGPYLVGRRIGGGGMAAIHLGRSVVDDSLVAIKVMYADMSRDAHYLDMFRDEAAILSRLRHPNIVRTLEYGIANEHGFIAMELLLGRTLADLWDVLAAREMPLPARVVAWLGARIASALHYAHELTDESGQPLHLVHRDANPSNIVITYDGDVKLIDFGLAKAARRHARTQDGVVKGKIPYLAPEQVRDRGVDARTDQFALGASLWECLAMKRLFKRENDLDTVRAIRDAVIPPLADLAPHCPPELAAVVMRALEHDPGARFPDAGVMAAALDAVFERNDDTSRGALANVLAMAFPGERAEREAWRERFTEPE